MKRAPTPSALALPDLHSGDRMTQEEFHRRYEQCPDDVKFELVGGTVQLAAPVRLPHAGYHSDLNLALGTYRAGTPGVDLADNATVNLGKESEPQPDLLLRVLEECGGQSKRNEKDYLVGAPELVAEVAHSSRAIDRNARRQDYLAAGVQEYLVLCIEEQEIPWFHFPSRRKLKPDRHGLWKSRVFPGLWLDGPALLARDAARLIAVVQRGLASPEHADLVARLQQRRGR